MSENKENIKINNNIDENLKLEEDIDVEFDRIWGTEGGSCSLEEFHRKMQATIELAKRGAPKDDM